MGPLKCQGSGVTAISAPPATPLREKYATTNISRSTVHTVYLLTSYYVMEQLYVASSCFIFFVKKKLPVAPYVWEGGGSGSTDLHTT